MGSLKMTTLQDGRNVGTTELRGKVKWFQCCQGFGFLALESDK